MDKGICFILGAAIGAVGAWLYLKNKYERRSEEEIASVRELYNKYQENSKLEKEAEKLVNECKEFNKVLKENGYVSEATEYETPDHPYPIPPEEFGLFYDYEQIELTLYADGVLTDDEGEPVDDDIGDMIGDNYMDHFGEYEDNAVYIRNDERKVDYEILRDERNYSDQEGG